MKGILKKGAFLVFILVAMFALTGYSTTTTVDTSEEVIGEQLKSDTNPEVAEKENLVMSITYGFGKMVKYGKNMRIQAEVTNKGDNFTGNLQVIMPQDNGKNVMYQKEAIIPTGETKTITLYIPVNTNLGRLNFMLVNKKGKTLVEKKVKISVSSDADILFTGVLSDDFNALSYIGDSRNNVFQVMEDNFPDDYLGLEALDILIINNYNTSKLSKEQYQGIKEFVQRGGTLVLGTGITGSKSLALFDDEFLMGKTGKLKKEKILFPESTLDKEILQMELEGARTIMKHEDAVILSSIQKDQGNILVFGFDMGLEYEQWNTVGKYLSNLIADNITMAKKGQIAKGMDGRNSYSLFEAIKFSDQGDLPKVGWYALALMIYILIVGPILYIILKKKDKRNLTWVLVPCLSLIFALIIFVMGNGTRLREPYIGYLSFITLGEENQAVEQSYFSITAPYNQAYSMVVDNKYRITPLNNANDFYYQDDSKVDDTTYKTGFKYSGDKTVVEMKNYAAFTPVYFETKQSIQMKGTYTSELSLGENGVTGTFTNQLGYNLSSVLLYSNNQLVLLGDVADGETVDVKGKKSYPLVTINDVYDMSVISDAVGGSPYDRGYSDNLITEYRALEYFLENQISYGQETDYVFGFANVTEGGGLMKDIQYKSTGISGLIMPVTVDTTSKDGITYIPNIDTYISRTDENVNLYDRYIGAEQAEVIYEFDKGDSILSLKYEASRNGEFRSGWNGYYGVIQAYNYKQDVYEEIFVSGTEREIMDLSNYISEDNKLKLLFDVDKDKQMEYNIIIPIISATKEEK